MKVVTVVGNRPQFVKAAPLSVALRAAGIDEVVVHTGQHWDDELSQVFIDELGLDEPDYRLDLRTAEVPALTEPIRSVVVAERPDAVLVLGDTNSTLAGARAGAEAGVPIAHVEAGLRSGDLSMPEERARIEVDGLAALLLCPDERSVATLRSEGVSGRAVVVGDVMADATLRFASIARERVPPPHARGAYVVATVHREANVHPEPLHAILAGLGFSRRFRYEKRREEWTLGECAVALDETSIGTFVEIEGNPAAIRRAVAALALDFSRAIPYAYARLYAERRREDPSLPPDMVFKDRKA